MRKDKKKKILYTAYSAIFVGICLVPSVLMPFVGADSSAENRTLAELPSVKTEEGKLNFSFFSEFETYFSEHFAFRQELVTLDGDIRAEIFGTSSNEDVIVGRDGWLYYTPTAEDFMNINTLSDRAINNINHNLALLSDYCDKQNAAFIFTIAPNKNSIYPEYMPYNYIETDNPGNLEKFIAVHDENEQKWMARMVSSTYDPDEEPEEIDFFIYCDLKSILLETKEMNSGYNTALYHKTDTHWNYLGALTAALRLIETAGAEMPDTSIAPSYQKNDWSGDLAEMIYPSAVPLDIQHYSSYDFTYQYVGRFRGFDDINIQTVCEGKNGKLLMYRDSFGEAVLPIMAESFGSAEFSRAVPYTTDSITDGTTVILEIVERNLGNLQKYAPVMPAPVYEEALPDGGMCSDVTLKTENSAPYTHIYGELGDEFFKDDKSQIFVTIDGVTYEAFNCFEDKLLGREDETSDNGFSLYIPQIDANGATDIGDITITVLSGNGETVSSGQ